MKNIGVSDSDAALSVCFAFATEFPADMVSDVWHLSRKVLRDTFKVSETTH